MKLSRSGVQLPNVSARYSSRELHANYAFNIDCCHSKRRNRLRSQELGVGHVFVIFRSCATTTHKREKRVTVAGTGTEQKRTKGKRAAATGRPKGRKNRRKKVKAVTQKLWKCKWRARTDTFGNYKSLYRGFYGFDTR